MSTSKTSKLSMFADIMPKQEPPRETAPEPTPAPDPDKNKKKTKPISVYLNEADSAYIQEIAKTYGESRHAVMQYAAKELIRQWKQGKKPRTNILGKLDK